MIKACVQSTGSGPGTAVPPSLTNSLSDRNAPLPAPAAMFTLPAKLAVVRHDPPSTSLNRRSSAKLSETNVQTLVSVAPRLNVPWVGTYIRLPSYAAVIAKYCETSPAQGTPVVPPVPAATDAMPVFDANVQPVNVAP